MDKFLFFCFFAATLLLSHPIYAQEEQKQKSPEEIATEQTNKLELELKLEPHQTFYVDSILSHDYRGLFDEIEKMKKSGAQEVTLYRQIQEKWAACIDSSFHKVFTEEQWYLYLRNHGKLPKEKKKKKSKKS